MISCPGRWSLMKVWLLEIRLQYDCIWNMDFNEVLPLKTRLMRAAFWNLQDDGAVSRSLEYYTITFWKAGALE